MFANKKGSRPSYRQPALIALALAAALSAATAIALQASTPLEVDGNAEDTVGVGGEDWDVNAVVIKRDAVASATTDDVFIQGGSKDGRDISQAGITQNYWLHGNSSVPGKDDIVQAFAKEYPKDGGGKLLYFGATRLVNDGDAAIGFWFFKNTVTEIPGGTFSGVHSVGDILVTADIGKGGGTSVINVFVWNGTPSSPLTLIKSSKADLQRGESLPQVFCAAGQTGGDNAVCAATNTTKVTIPANFGDYVFGSGSNPSKPTDNMFPPGTFFEGGIDLGALGLDTASCFSSVLTMTRSSASPDAQLKDFALQKFGSCGVEIKALCTSSAVATSGDFITSKYDVSIKSLGGTISNVAFQEDITLSPPSSNNGMPAGFPRCKRTDTGEWLTSDKDTAVTTSLVANDTKTVKVECDHDATEKLFNNVTASASDGIAALGDSFIMTTTCPSPIVTGIEVVKACDTVELALDGRTVQPKVCNKLTVTNKSTEGLTDVKVFDQPDGATAGVQVTQDAKTKAAVPTTLAVGGSFNVLYCYTPTTTNGAETTVGAAAFHNTAMVTAKGAVSTTLPKDDSDEAQCDLCPKP